MPIVGTTPFNTAGDCFDLIRALLNDRDIPQIQTIPQLGCARVGNVTTVTLPIPHNLQINNIVQVGFVDDPTFNGTQIVLTCPTPNQFTYANTGANATSGNGTVSLIVQGDVYIDAVLVPHVNKAFRKVQRKLLKGGSPTATDEIILTLGIGANVLSDSTLPQLPGDFIAPRTIREKVSGSSGFYGAYLSRRNQLPDAPQGPYNNIYSWFGDELHFPGATQALDIVLRYEKGSQAISDATSVLTVRGCLDVVATYGAYYAARAHDSPKADSLMADAEQEMDEFLSSQAHARQYLPARRRAYGRSSGGRIRGWT